MSLPHEFRLIIPVPSCALPAPFAALDVQGDAEKVHSIHYIPNNKGEVMDNRPQNQLAAEIERQLRAYLENPKSARFSHLPLRAAATPYQQKVRNAVLTIPYGKTRTYGEIAEQMGHSHQAARPVGQACRNSPLAIIVPCYRAVGVNDIGGFAGNIHVKNEGIDLAIKRWLLKRERIHAD